MRGRVRGRREGREREGKEVWEGIQRERGRVRGRREGRRRERERGGGYPCMNRRGRGYCPVGKGARRGERERVRKERREGEGGEIKEGEKRMRERERAKEEIKEQKK